MIQENKPRILNIVDNRWWSGTSYFAVYTTKALQDFGLTSDIVGDHRTLAIGKAKELGLNVLSGFNPRSTNPLKYFSELSGLLNLIKKGEYTHLIPHGPPSHFWATRAKKKLGDKINVIRALSDDMTPKVNFLSKNIYTKYTDSFIASSEALVKTFSKAFDIPRGKFKSFLGPLDMTEFEIDANSNGKENKQVVFGLIARFSPVKGHSIFLKSAALALKQNKNLKFLISGEEVQIKKSDLKNICENLGISDSVKLLDNFDNLSEVLSRVDVGVIPSIFSEVICRIGMEYMASGKAVIASDVNVLPELVINGESGLIFNSEDEVALADAILKLAEDKELRRKYGIAGRKRAEEIFSIEKFADRLTSIL